MKRFSREEIADYQKLAHDPHGGSLYEVLARVLSDIIQQLLSDNEEMEKALEFYADADKYEYEWDMDGAHDAPEIISDEGKLASATLNKLRGES